MNTFKILASRSVVFLILAMLVFIPASAQDGEWDGTIVDPLVLPPYPQLLEINASNYYCISESCGNYIAYQFINLIGIDWSIGSYAPDQAGSLALDWQFSDNNRVVTIQLEEDLLWSDGTPITADDVMMSYELGSRADANRNGEAGVEDLNRIFENVEALDEHTLRITFPQGTCNVLNNVNRYLKVVPSHIYLQLIDEVGYAELRNHPYFNHQINLDEKVVSGPWRLAEFYMIDEITLDYSIYERNDLYTDNALGYVAAERLLEKNYYTEDDTDAYLEGFLNEEFGHIGVAGLDQRNALADLAQEKNIDRVLIPSTFYHFIPLNRADPNNPQPAVDENGNRIDQGLHPLFGDKLTRQAIARAYDVDSAVEEIFEGLGVRQTSYVVPSAWSYNYDLPPIPYDPELALEMLAKSGWVPENSDQPASADNRLVCQDCLYAREVDPDFNGSYFEFDILWNEPNDLRRRLALTVQEDLNAIGITANLVQLTFNDYLEAILGQTFDAAIVGLQNGIPYTPDTTDIFGAESDQPGRGLNFTSFYDEGYYALEQTALTVAGCGLTERTLIYRRMQEIIQDDVPAIYIGNAQREYAHHEWLVGVEPYPNSFAWNIDTWRVVHDE